MTGRPEREGLAMERGHRISRRRFIEAAGGAGIVLASGIRARTAAEIKPLTLKMSFGQTLSHPLGAAMQKAADVVKEKSGGKMTIQLFPMGTLGTERENAESMQIGALSGGVISTGFTPTFVPESAIVMLPFLFKDIDRAYAALDGEASKVFAEHFRQKGFVLLGFWDNARFRHLTNNKRPIVKPEDLRGLKVRTLDNPIQISTYRRLGAIPTPMSIGEVYSALQQGVVDGQENPLANIYTTKFYEVQKYVSLIGMQYDPMVFVMNPKLWDSLSSEARAVIQAAFEEGRAASRALAKSKEAEFGNLLKQAGMQFNNVDVEAFRVATRPVWDEFVKDAKTKQLVALLSA
jgi:TRAP-type transport system periplasmic protein